MYLQYFHDNILIQNALQFATHKHGEINQKRKYTNEPYIIHPIRVAEIVATVNHTPEMIAAALLHDTLEDTYTTVKELQNNFGTLITSYVQQLTKVSQLSDGNRKQRILIDRNHLKQSVPSVQTIKLADIMDNISTIVSLDEKFAKIYLLEKEYELTVLTQGDERLFHTVVSILQQSINTLGINALDII